MKFRLIPLDCAPPILLSVCLLISPGCIHHHRNYTVADCQKLYDNRDYQNAKVCFTRLVNSGKADAQSLFLLGRSLMELDELDAAGRYLSEAIQRDPELSPAFTSLGIIAILKEDYGNAAIFLRNALLLNPRDVSALNNLGYTFLVSKDFVNAIRYYQQANDIDPLDPISNLNLAEIYRKVLLDIPQTMEHYRRYLLSDKKETVTALEIRAWMQEHQNQAGLHRTIPDGQPLLETETTPSVLNADRDDGTAGTVESNQMAPLQPHGNGKDLTTTQNEATLVPDRLSSRDYLSLMQGGEESYRRARDILLKQIELFPANATLHGKLAIVSFRLGQVRMALKELQIAKNLGTQDSDVIDLMEQVYLLRQELSW